MASAACDGSPPPGGGPDAAGSLVDAAPAGCPLRADGRTLVEELGRETAFELALAVSSDPIERNVGHFLPGVDADRVSHFTLARECQDTGSSVTCESQLDDGEDPFLAERDACIRLGCRPDGSAEMEAYWTMRPHTEPGDRHPFSYPTTSPPGLAISEPNWLVTWQLDLDPGARTRTAAAFDRTLVVEPDEGEPVDLGHTGTAEAEKPADQPLAGSFVLDFPRLAADGAPIRLETVLAPDPDDAGLVAVTGTLAHRDRPIAALSGRLDEESPPRLTWQGPCE